MATVGLDVHRGHHDRPLAADGIALLDLDEAVRVRELGWDKPVLLLEGIFEPADVELADRHRLTVAVHCDEQLDLLKATGGVIQITAVPAFLKAGRKEEEVTVADYVDHVDHAVKRIGIEHVGISSDFDGGGGIVLGAGSTNYTVANNFVAGNFALGHGAGVKHFGLSPNGLINSNTIVFNETFAQSQTTNGGGVFVGGTPGIAGALTPGSGTVTVSNNLIQGNGATGGEGGGVALLGVNGLDTNSVLDPVAPGLPVAS